VSYAVQTDLLSLPQSRLYIEFGDIESKKSETGCINVLATGLIYLYQLFAY